jgi:hypothetical protein
VINAEDLRCDVRLLVAFHQLMHPWSGCIFFVHGDKIALWVACHLFLGNPLRGNFDSDLGRPVSVDNGSIQIDDCASDDACIEFLDMDVIWIVLDVAGGGKKAYVRA